MKRLTSTELGALALALVLITGGLACLLWPREMVAVHATTDVDFWPGSFGEVVSKAGSRVYGAFAIFFGTSLAVFAIYRGRP